MFAKTLITTVALFAATSALAQDAMIKEVDVTTEITAIGNESAATYWATLDADLESAILARLVDRIGENGTTISIDIDELSLANSVQNKLGLEDAVLVGQVGISNMSDNSVADGYELTVTAKTAQAFAPDGTVLEGGFTDTPEYYTALVAAFADGVVSRLK